MKKKYENLKQAITMEIKEHKSSAIVYFLLRAIVILILILQILNGNYENVFYCVLTLILMIVPSFVQVTFKIELPSTLEVIILVFIFAAEILGEINHFYYKFPYWDTVLHTMNGFLAAAIGFSLVDLLNRHERLKFDLSPVFICIVSFCFSMTIGVLWEFIEFSADTYLHMNMQKDTVIQELYSIPLDDDGDLEAITNIHSTIVNGQELPIDGYLDIGLIDTMQDLFVNFIGAVVFSIFGFFYIKNRGKGIANRFIPTRKSKEKDFLAIVKNEQVEP